MINLMVIFRRHPDIVLFDIYRSSSLLSESHTVKCSRSIFASCLTTFYDFLTRQFKKKRKKSRFLKSEKKHKIRILEQWRKRIGPKEIEMPLWDKLV